MDFIVADDVADARGIQQDFEGRDAAALRAHDKTLGNDRAQVQRQVGQHILVCGIGEEVESRPERARATKMVAIISSKSNSSKPCGEGDESDCAKPRL